MKRCKSFLTMILAGAGFAAAQSAGAATILNIQVAADTYLRSEGPGPNSKSDNDDQDENIVGVNGGASSKLNGLFRFDLSPILNLGPAQNIVINSVTLTLTPRADNPGTGTTIDLTLNNYGFNFVEADATYNDPDGNGFIASGDNTPGGTPGPLLSSLIGFDPVPNVLAPIVFGDTAAFRSAIAAELAGDATINFLLRGTSSETASFIRYYDDTVAQRAFLTIDASVVPEPTSLALLGLGGLFIARRRRA